MKNDVWAATQPADPDGDVLRSTLLDAKVMMLDDEPLMTDLIQAYLEDDGYRNFVVANDPRHALETLRREEPAVLLLDLMMPQVSGFDLLRAIRADRALRYTPVIVLTAATGPDAKLEALQLGVTDFLSKPVDPSELVLRVRNTLAFHQYHKRLVDFDLVTNLPGSRLFDRGIEDMQDRRDLVGGHLMLFSIVVPECRTLRETIDQSTADGLSRVIARRLERFAAEAAPSSPFATRVDRAPRVARLSNERFGIVLEGVKDGDTAESLVERLLVEACVPIGLGAHEIVPTVSIGISMSPGDGHTVDALRRSADLAASHARLNGPMPYKFASPELNARSYEQLALGLQLRNAAQRGELVLHYQPKVDIASRRIVGLEALVRWQHAVHGLLSPAQFIPLAEELGLIGVIGEWVLERACRDVAAWGRAGFGELSFAVNVAKPQFVSGDLCATLRRVLGEHGLAPRQLVVELTESMLMDDMPAGLALMHQLKALGVTLSIDDFGTGYSSLSYLKRFPLDELKIDRSFITDLPGEPQDVAIARTVIDLGHRLGMRVIAEGVETEAQLACLRDLGCETYQGFLFSRPIPADQFQELLVRHGAATAVIPALPV